MSLKWGHPNNVDTLEVPKVSGIELGVPLYSQGESASTENLMLVHMLMLHVPDHQPTNYNYIVSGQGESEGEVYPLWHAQDIM